MRRVIRFGDSQELLVDNIPASTTNFITLQKYVNLTVYSSHVKMTVHLQLLHTIKITTEQMNFVNETLLTWKNIK